MSNDNNDSGDITKSCGWQEEKRWRILTGDET